LPDYQIVDYFDISYNGCHTNLAAVFLCPIKAKHKSIFQEKGRVSFSKKIDEAENNLIDQ
jgi:hypothetical protein